MQPNSLVFEQETKIILMRQAIQDVLEELDEAGEVSIELQDKLTAILNDDVDDLLETLDD